MYDTAGNLTNTYSGQTPTSGACGTSGGTRLQYKYQGDSRVTSCGGKPGELCETIAPNREDHHLRLRHFRANNLGDTCLSAGGTTYTYDSESRVATVIDGNGKRTYSYDNMDPGHPDPLRSGDDLHPV